MSYPPPPGQDPNNPYAAPPQGGQPGYGYPQQGPPQQAYGYPQQSGYPQQGGIPAFPGGPMQPNVARMPGPVITARVLLFVAGSLWGLFAVIMLIGFLAASDAVNDVPGLDGVSGGAAGVGVIFFLVFGGLAALHIVPASMFGKGRAGTRITAIIAASINSLLPLLGFVGAASSNSDAAPGGAFLYILWLATAILTIVFCALGASGQWFNRHQY